MCRRQMWREGHRRSCWRRCSRRWSMEPSLRHCIPDDSCWPQSPCSPRRVGHMNRRLPWPQSHSSREWSRCIRPTCTSRHPSERPVRSLSPLIACIPFGLSDTHPAARPPRRSLPNPNWYNPKSGTRRRPLSQQGDSCARANPCSPSAPADTTRHHTSRSD